MLAKSLSAVLVLLALVTHGFADAGVVNVIGGGEKGWTGWTSTGSAWHESMADRLGNPFPKVPHMESGEQQTGALRSPTFTVKGDVIRLWINGWDGRAGGMNSAGFVLKSADDEAVLRTVKPPLRDPFTPASFFVSDLKGRRVYLEAYDNNTAGGFAWIGLARMEEAEMEVPAEASVYRAVAIPAGLGAWSVLTYDGAGSNTNPYLSSLGRGETAVGTVRSPEFVVSNTKIRLLLRGHDGKQGGQSGSRVDLVDAESGNVLRSAVPPLSDSPSWTEWDVSGFAGKRVYLQLSDLNNNQGYAWMGLDEVDAGDGYRVRFSVGQAPEGWKIEGYERSFSDIEGVPFLAEPASPVVEGGTVTIPLGFKAKRLLLLGMTHSLDQGNNCWFDPNNYRVRFFVGDTVGRIKVNYAGGTTESFPLVIGESVWWGRRFFEFPEPFVSDRNAATALKRSLRLYPPKPVPDGRYLAALPLRDDNVESVEVSGVEDKAGAPVILGLTAEFEKGAPMPDLPPLPHSKLSKDLTAFIESRPLRAHVDLTALDSLRNAFYTTARNFPKQVTVKVPKTYRGPEFRFSGNACAEVLTNILYHNLNDIAAKVDAEGMYHTSTQGAASWGGYEGFGAYRNGVGSYFTHTWSRDMGRSLGELVAFGRLDKAKVCADYVFRMARLWETGVAPDDSNIEYRGVKLPRHVCRIMNLPNATPGEGCFENDGHGLTGLFIYNLWRHLPERGEWLRVRWDDVRGLGDWVTWQLDHPDISGATRTLQTDSECSAGIGHSVYADMACMEALRGLAEMADSIGESDKAAEWRGTAERLRLGIEAEYIVTESRYGKVWTLKSAGWPNLSTVLGPLMLLADRRGFGPEADDPKWRPITEAAYQRLIDGYKPFGFYGVAMGYGQGFVTQSALLLDRMREATTMLEWAARATWTPNHESYIVPEGCEVEPGGRFWHRTGDLGNGVQEAEIVKAIRLVIGIDDNSKDSLRFYPRLPFGWSQIRVAGYPVRTGSTLDYQVERKESGMRLLVSSDKPMGSVEARLGPFADRPSGRVTLNGASVEGKVERSGDSWWLRVGVENAGRQLDLNADNESSRSSPR